MVFLPSNKKPTQGGRSSYVQTRLSGRVVVLQAELVEQREHPKAIDVIRREQHIDPARVLTVTLDNQVLGEQLGVFHVAFQLQLGRSEEHTSELQSLMRISYAVFCLKQKKNNKSY